MPRNLTASRRVLELKDGVTHEKFEMYYRLPTNQERVTFSNSLFEKKGKKTAYKENIFSEQLALGKLLCTGFKEGYFMDGDLFISSDQSKPYYRENWKNLIEGDLPEAFQQIAVVVMRPVAPSAPDDAEEEASDATPDADQAQAQEATEDAPLSSSSEAS